LHSRHLPRVFRVGWLPQSALLFFYRTISFTLLPLRCKLCSSTSRRISCRFYWRYHSDKPLYGVSNVPQLRIAVQFPFSDQIRERKTEN
jgi:hypothetical protein